MTEVLPFVTKYDPLKPDFIEECVNDGQLRTQDPTMENMTTKEREFVRKKEEKYY